MRHDRNQLAQRVDIESASLLLLPSDRDSVTQNSQQALKELIVRVRELAQNRLVQFAKLDVAECKEPYLFSKDHFCGIKFSLGPFRAEWRVDHSQIQFSRSGNNIGQIEIDPAASRRAA